MSRTKPAQKSGHTAEYRIYYEDTDAAGIVYHANYLKFAERARTEWLRELGFNQSELREKEGVGFVMHHCAIDFLAPAKLDDMLTIETHLQEAGKVRMTMSQKIMRGVKELAVLTVKLACVNRQGRPVALPAELKKVLVKSEPARGHVTSD